MPVMAASIGGKRPRSRAGPMGSIPPQISTAKRVSFRTPPTAVRVPPARRGKAGAATLVAADRLPLRVVGRRVVEDGASRARTAARLGAIQALSGLESDRFPGLLKRSGVS